MRKRKLIAWVLAAVMSFGTFGGESITAFADSPNPAVVQDAAEEFDTWAAGVTDAEEVAAKKAIWMDVSKTVDERVEALLSVMTMEEKIAQMVQPEQNSDATPEVVKELGIGSVLSGGGSAPEAGNSAQDWANRVNEFKAAALQSRLGIPLIYGVDAVHGHNNVSDTVIFPHNIGYGAADNAELARESGAVAAEEIRATGIQWTFAPTLGVPYNERWGRYYECFGEDEDLVARIGAAFVEGFQSTVTMDGTDAQHQAIGDTSVAATAKHYVGEGQTADGVNQGNVAMSAAAFEELLAEENLLKPYEDAIAAGAKIVMASFNSVDGVKCHGNKRLLTEILKGEKTVENPLGLNFQGFIVSDYSGHAQIEEGTYKNYYITGAADKYTAQVAASIDAGVDMFMEPYDWAKFMDAVEKNLEAGIISTERIDDAVTRILRVKFEMGLFEEEVASETELDLLAAVGSEEHRAVARQAVEESLVVLKNDTVGTTGKTALQLLEEAQSIRVAGYKANDIGAQCGGWTVSWQGGYDSANGSGGNKVTTGTTVVEGFRQLAGEGVEVTYSGRGNITGQDAAVVVVSEPPYAEYAGDRAADGLVLEEADLNVIKTAIASKGDTPLVLVLMTGRPIAIADFIDDFDAVVEAWLPGTEGDGIASVMLDSEKDFKGTLPVTWTWYPQDLTEKFTDTSKVLFPFGTGLKKDGTSIKDGGQTEIPGVEDRPEAPEKIEVADAPKYKGGIDIDANGNKLEAEWCEMSGDFASSAVSVSQEVAEGNKVGYVNYDKGNWANAKWKVYVRQQGTYKVTARMNITEGQKMQFSVGTKLANDPIGDVINVDATATDGYVDIVVGEFELKDGVGIYGVKIMDIDSNPNDSDWTSGYLKAKLDYLTFELIEPYGEKDTGVEVEVEEEDPTDETPKASKGNMIAEDVVEVYMTSTEATQDWSWYKYPTEMANQMTQKDSLPITSVDDQEMTTILIDPDKEYQELLGLGTSLEESTINNIAKMKPEMQDKFLRMLIDPEQAGMTLLRITIGTSDFTSQPFYTYYDAVELTEENALVVDGELVPDWYNETGKGFSIQKDIDCGIIEVVQKVLELAEEYGVEDEIRFFASSWTPPGWTKEETDASKSYKSYNSNENLIMGGALKDECIDDVAMYYTRYLEEYAKLGIDIYAITLQNEPLLEIEYPSCYMTGEQEGKLAVAIKEAVAASTVLNEEQKQVKLWAFDHNPSDAYGYVQKILSVEGANEAIDGIAFHDYSGELSLMQKVQDELLNQNGRTGQTVNLTERAVWGTEGANCIITYLRNSAISYNSWVTMLDSNIGVHQWVGEPAPPIFSRDAYADDDFWPMPEYYILGQFSKFIRPGYVRVDSNLGSKETVTNVVFKNPETGELVAVVVNDTQKKQNFKLVCEGTQIIGAVPADSVATYVWSMPENVHNNVEQGFAATEYSGASEGVSIGTDESNAKYVTTASAEDYVDYIINVEETGTYGIIMEQQPTAENQSIDVYQDDELLCKVVATKTWNSAKVNVRGTVTLDHTGVQQIRVKMTEGVNLYKIALVKMPDAHAVPGKIPADEYITIVDDGGALMGATVTDAHRVENSSAWSTFKYKVNVPADGTYTLTLSSATDVGGEGDARGFYAVVDDLENGGYQKAVLCNVDWGQTVTYVPSGDWGTYNEHSIDLELTEGEHIIGIKIAAATNLAWLAIGSYVDMEATEITEGAEDGQTIALSVTGGTIAADEDILVEGLPTGVDYSVNMADENHLTLTLEGNRQTDFDKNITVAVKVPIIQPNDEVLYSQVEFVIAAVSDAESLVKPDSVNPVALEGTVTVPIKLQGGTFNDKVLEQIVVSGNALQNYTVSDITLADAQTVNITLTYDKKIYKAAELMVEVPVTAFDDSTGSVSLNTSVMFNAEEALPTAIEADGDGVITLTENLAYATNGSFESGAQKGDFVNYFINVPATAEYTVVYTVKTAGDGSGYSGAWNLNRGVPGTIGTNSYKGMNIPSLWTGSEVQLRQYVELVEGAQTFEMVAGTGGYSVTKIEIVPVSAQAISATEATTIAAGSFIDYAQSAVVLGENVEYTTTGTALDYLVETQKAGTYSISVNYAIESSSNVSMTFSTVVGDSVTALGTVALPATGNWGTYWDSEPVEIALPAGVTTVRLQYAGNAGNLKKITITPVDLKDDLGENPFGDVKDTDWFKPYVMFAYEHGLMGGKGSLPDGTLKFDPSNTITRAEFVTMLYAKENKPAVEYVDTFTDVPDDKWYTDAILWAAEKEIVGGKKADYFDVNGMITRQEIALILYKYALYNEYSTEELANADFSGFADASKVSNWAETGMKWAVEYNVIGGKNINGEMLLSPGGNAIRAEAATMMKAFMVAYEDAE